MQQPEPLDVAIVGAGICGVIVLHYARRAGLHARVFEKQAGVGGLWRQLPAWQDIQIGTHDWALGDFTLDSPFQPEILKNIHAWVERFGLEDGISLETPVLSARHEGGLWHLATPEGSWRARHLVAASGAHNRPHVPGVARDAVELREYHSSALRDPGELKGRRVLVVGGGASAFDLLDLCFEQGAAAVYWAHRHVRWMTPARKPKHIVGGVREFGRLQMSGATAEQINAGLEQDLRGRYEKFGLQAIMPSEPLDLRRHQLVPGRPRMVENFAAIRRFHGTVVSVRGNTAVLSSGDAVEADLLLWGTGYEVDLSYFESPGLGSIRSLEVLQQRCGGIFISLDEPNLYFPAVSLDGIGSATWLFALLARAIVAHIQGRGRLDKEPVPHRVNHFDLVAYLAARDSVNFPEGRWQAEYRALAHTPEGQPFPLP